MDGHPDLEAPGAMDQRPPSPRGAPRPRSRSPPRSRSRSRSRSPPRRRERSRSRSRSPRGRRSPPRRYVPPVRSADTSESTTLFIGNLSYNIGERELFDIMDRVGRVRNVTIGWNQRTNQSRGYAFVQFADRRAAEAAYDHFKYYNLDGRPLRVDWDEGLDKKAPARPNDRGGDRRRDDRYGRRSRSPRRDRRSRSPPRRRSRSPRDDRRRYD